MNVKEENTLNYSGTARIVLKGQADLISIMVPIWNPGKTLPIKISSLLHVHFKFALSLMMF